MPIGPIVGIVSSLMGATQAFRDTRGRPRDWRTYLLWAGAAITVAVAVADAMRAQKDAELEAQRIAEQNAAKRRKR